MIALTATLILGGCSDDDESTNGGIATISLSTDIIQVDKSGGSATITVTSSDDWRLSGVCDWVHPSATSGTDGDIVTFTIDPNKLDEERTATFKFFTGSSVVALQVESQSAYVMDLLSDANPSISKDASKMKIELNTKVADLTIDYSDASKKWLIFNKRSDFSGKTTLSFTATENDTYKDRSATITITSPLVAEPVIVNVNQRQTDAIVIENNTLMYDLTARTISFNMRYNIDYGVSITQGNDWITSQSISEPQLGDDGLSTITLTYNLDAASTTRGGTIHIAKTNGMITSDISVIQKDPDVELGEIQDDNFRSLCISNNWIQLLTGSQFVVLEEGLNATILYNPSYSNQINDFSGIENFPNLTTLELGYCTKMRKLDISGLHKVSSVSFSSTRDCEEYNLGDNPISSFEGDGIYGYSYAESIKIISSKLNSLDLSIISGNVSIDYVTSIDVSECPALTTLNANRSKKIKTLYLKTGQIIPNLTKNDATTIVYK